MSAILRQEAISTIDYTPGADVAAGLVVALDCGLYGVVKTALLSGEKGAAYIKGNFEVTSAAGFAADAGDPAYFDPTGKTVVQTPVAGGYTIGCYASDKASADTTAMVLLNVQPSVGEGAGLSSDVENVGTAAPALATRGTSNLSGAANACAATLADGDRVGQMKLVVATNIANAVTLTVATHLTSTPEVFTFAAAGATLLLVWNGTKWATISTVVTPTV